MGAISDHTTRRTKGPVKIYGNMGLGSGIWGHLKFYRPFGMGPSEIFFSFHMGPRKIFGDQKYGAMNNFRKSKNCLYGASDNFLLFCILYFYGASDNFLYFRLFVFIKIWGHAKFWRKKIEGVSMGPSWIFGRCFYGAIQNFKNFNMGPWQIFVGQFYGAIDNFKPEKIPLPGPIFP